MTGEFGPVFMAEYEGRCESCDDPVVPGEDIRATGEGGYVHASDECERVAVAVSTGSRSYCLTCFQVPAVNGACGCER